MYEISFSNLVASVTPIAGDHLQKFDAYYLILDDSLAIKVCFFLVELYLTTYKVTWDKFAQNVPIYSLK